MITLILVRHGDREHTRPDAEAPLTDIAHGEARELGAHLRDLILGPAVVLTSTHLHSQETARAIVDAAELPDPEDAAFLTPEENKKIVGPVRHWADHDLHQALSACIQEGVRTVIMVGHETRLSQLVLRFTGARQRPLDALDAISISAVGVRDLWLGKATVDWRHPVRDWLEKEIGGKLTSKMAVATFLASANFIALMEIIIGQRQVLGTPAKQVPTECASSCPWMFLFDPPWFLIWLALLSHFTAAGLFIATVYLYDRLSMPIGFWELRRPNWIKRDDRNAYEALHLHGYPHAHMIRIWQDVFTPAVLLSMIGVFCLIATTGVGLALIVAAIVAIAIKRVFDTHRPTGSID